DASEIGDRKLHGRRFVEEEHRERTLVDGRRFTQLREREQAAAVLGGRQPGGGNADALRGDVERETSALARPFEDGRRHSRHHALGHGSIIPRASHTRAGALAGAWVVRPRRFPWGAPGAYHATLLSRIILYS